MPDYESILQTQWDEIPTVKTLPDGTYLLTGRAARFQKPKSDDQDPSVLFIYGVNQSLDDVDVGALDALGDDYDLGINRIYTRVYLENKSDWDKVRKHIAKHAGADLSGTLEEGLASVEGSEVTAVLGTRTYTDKSGDLQVENEAGSFTSPDDS
jgi:hypothetical protein